MLPSKARVCLFFKAYDEEKRYGHDESASVQGSGGCRPRQSEGSSSFMVLSMFGEIQLGLNATLGYHGYCRFLSAYIYRTTVQPQRDQLSLFE